MLQKTQKREYEQVDQPELVNERIGDPPSLGRLDRVLRNAQSHPYIEFMCNPFVML